MSSSGDVATTRQAAAGLAPSRRRDCHYAAPPSSSTWKHLRKGGRGCSRMTVSPTAIGAVRRGEPSLVAFDTVPRLAVAAGLLISSSPG